MIAEARTAIKRNKLSKPAFYLKAKGLLKGAVIDYGCGRGDDARELKCDGWDKHHDAVGGGALPLNEYDTVMCNYVLNVLRKKDDRNYVIDDMIALMAPGGVGYISVRNDRNALNGKTLSGSWQGFIDLDLEIVTMNRAFVMYKVTEKDLCGEYHTKWNVTKTKNI